MGTGITVTTAFRTPWVRSLAAVAGVAAVTALMRVTLPELAVASLVYVLVVVLASLLGYLPGAVAAVGSYLAPELLVHARLRVVPDHARRRCRALGDLRVHGRGAGDDGGPGQRAPQARGPTRARRVRRPDGRRARAKVVPVSSPR